MRIVITGAESSGKTTLISDLADYYKTSFTKEFARDYLQTNGAEYVYSDLVTIAKGQHLEIIANEKLFTKIHLVDTDLLTIKIWSEYKFGKCDPWIIKTMDNNKPDFYLLCSPDIPWVKDPLRENPKDRQELFQIYENEIRKVKVPYKILDGSKKERKDEAIRIIENLKTSE